MSNPSDHSFFYDEKTGHYSPPRTEGPTMSEAKHSPLPWRHEGGFQVWTGGGDIVAHCDRAANAAFIVLATSLHHELVAALELARQTFRDRGIPDEVIPITLGRINAALQKAKQGDKQ